MPDYSKFRASKKEVEAFYTKPFDTAGARKKMLARIDRTLKQLNGDKVAPQGGKDFETLENNGVVYRPTLNGFPIEFADTGDEDGFHATRDNLLRLLPLFVEDVEAGTFDEQLKFALTTQASGVAAIANKSTTKGRGITGAIRQSGLPPRADGLPHRVAASEAQPHPDYILNTTRTAWRSPEQVAADVKSADLRKASVAKKEGKKA